MHLHHNTDHRLPLQFTVPFPTTGSRTQTKNHSLIISVFHHMHQKVLDNLCQTIRKQMTTHLGQDYMKRTILGAEGTISSLDIPFLD